MSEHSVSRLRRLHELAIEVRTKLEEALDDLHRAVEDAESDADTDAERRELEEFKRISDSEVYGRAGLAGLIQLLDYRLAPDATPAARPECPWCDLGDCPTHG